MNILFLRDMQRKTDSVQFCPLWSTAIWMTNKKGYGFWAVPHVIEEKVTYR